MHNRYHQHGENSDRDDLDADDEVESDRYVVYSDEQAVPNNTNVDSTLGSSPIQVRELVQSELDTSPVEVEKFPARYEYDHIVGCYFDTLQCRFVRPANGKPTS